MTHETKMPQYKMADSRVKIKIKVSNMSLTKIRLMIVHRGKRRKGGLTVSRNPINLLKI